MSLSSRRVSLLVERKGAARILMCCLIQQVRVCMHITRRERGAETRRRCVRVQQACVESRLRHLFLRRAGLSAHANAHRQLWTPTQLKPIPLFLNVTFGCALALQHVLRFPKPSCFTSCSYFMGLLHFHPKQPKLSKCA